MNNYEIAGTIIQVLTVFGLIYSLYLTRREFVVHERPYVGFIEILKKHSDKTNELEFNVLVNNTGVNPVKLERNRPPTR